MMTSASQTLLLVAFFVTIGVPAVLQSVFASPLLLDCSSIPSCEACVTKRGILVCTKFAGDFEPPTISEYMKLATQSGTDAADPAAPIHPEFVVGWYGNWCGAGYPPRGTNPAAKDAVDSCCRTHDKCYDAYGMDRCSCDLSLLSCLQSAKNSNGVSWTGKVFANSATALFSSLSCKCANKSTCWPVARCTSSSGCKSKGGA